MKSVSLPMLSATEQRLVDGIARRHDELVCDLATWVAVPSGRGHSSALEEMRGLLIGRLVKLGATPHEVQGAVAPTWLREGPTNAAEPPSFVVCKRLRPNARAHILLCGHVDTVHDPAGSFNRLVISQDGTKATGPGCADMKGGLLVAIAALEALESAGVPVSWSFAIVSDEETGTFHADAALRDEAARGYTHGLVFEPALPNGSLVVERPGSGQFMIECRGRSAHVGRDFVKGISAVRALADATIGALSLADPARGLLVNIGPLEGNDATNIVPDRARAWGNVRCTNSAAQATAKEGLLALNANHGQLPSTHVELLFNRPSKPKTPAVEQLAMQARSAAESLGQQLPFGVTGGVCDGNNMQAAGLPVIDTLGVRGGGLHTLDEWIDLSSLVQRTQLAAVLMARLASA